MARYDSADYSKVPHPVFIKKTKNVLNDIEKYISREIITKKKTGIASQRTGTNRKSAKKK